MEIAADSSSLALRIEGKAVAVSVGFASAHSLGRCVTVVAVIGLLAQEISKRIEVQQEH